MKPFFAALAILAITFPAASQGNHAPAQATPPSDPGAYYPAIDPAAPLSGIAQQAFDSCPGLMSRTESAVASGHVQSFYIYDCECMAQSIDYNTWDTATASYSGPKMSDDEAYMIRNSLAGAATIEEAFTLIDGALSEQAYSATSACYGK